MNFVCVVNKEAGYTSRDVVNKLNKVFNTKKIGHTGTLDPIAEGVLVVCVNKYTKLVDLLTSLDKEYIATIRLGVETDTLDITGKVINKKEYNFTEEELKKVLKSFIGKQTQKVPKYSAVKINGKKLYEYARDNVDITLPTRDIEIYDIDLIEYKDDLVTFKVHVSKGTYIRSLIKDICTKLNTVGTMESLVRTKQGKFSIENSYSIEQIMNNDYQVLKLKDLFDYPTLELEEDLYNKVKNGNKINLDNEDGLIILTYNKEEIAIYEINNGLAKPYIML